MLGQALCGAGRVWTGPYVVSLGDSSVTMGQVVPGDAGAAGVCWDGLGLASHDSLPPAPEGSGPAPAPARGHFCTRRLSNHPSAYLLTPPDQRHGDNGCRESQQGG